MSLQVMHGLVPLDRFKAITGMSELQFKKGKGRQFVSTPVGVVFMAEKFDKSNKEMYVTVAGPGVESKTGQSLEGTLWLVNAALQDGDVL